MKKLIKNYTTDIPVSQTINEIQTILAQLSEMLRNVKQPDNIDIEEIQRRIEEQCALVEDMQLWLDKYLKN